MSIDIDDVNEYDSELDTVVDSLINYLKDDLRLGEHFDVFHNEWPEANNGENEKILACHTVTVKHNYTFPTLLSKQDIIGDTIKTAALYRVGSYDIALQVDMWFTYKSQRNKAYKKFYEVINEDMLNNDFVPSGLSLKLENYFDTIARYDISGYTFTDDERSSQEDEWRVKIDLKVHFDKKLQKVMHKINETVIVTSNEIEEYISEKVQIN